MVDLKAFSDDVNLEVSTILASDFSIEVTSTNSVPHSDDAAITFPNLDSKSQGTKTIETTVLYIDMRRSTELSLKHKRHTVAKLYSAFVRAMTRCAGIYGGEVRGIIGDRVMVIFNKENCFTNAVNTAILMSSVCQKIINKHFKHNEVTFGIGIDYGTILATKTGIRRNGSAKGSYRSLVWLGRPANIASKLTDNANKPAERVTLDKVIVKFGSGLGTYSQEYYTVEFVKQFYFNASTGRMHHFNPLFHSFRIESKIETLKEATPPILMTDDVYKGYKAANPTAPEIQNGWWKLQDKIKDYSGDIYGGDVIFNYIQG